MELLYHYYSGFGLENCYFVSADTDKYNISSHQQILPLDDLSEQQKYIVVTRLKFGLCNSEAVDYNTVQDRLKKQIDYC
jgi:hypothetical protein